MTNDTRTKGATFRSQPLKQIIEEAIAHHEQACAQIEQTKEGIKHSRQAADEAWRVLRRASSILQTEIGEASVPTLGVNAVED